MEEKINKKSTQSNILKIVMVFLGTLVIFVGAFSIYNQYQDKLKKDTDAYKFKEEYEEYNGKTNALGTKYLNVDISDDNIIKYATVEEIIDTIESGTGIIYFGFPTCPWCRNAIGVLFDAANDAEVEQILYLNVYELRDKYEVIDNKLVKTDAEGEGYYELLDALDSVLTDYVVYDSNNTSYETGEKRLYAPTIVFVKDGSIVANHVGTVTLPSGQTAYDSLTDTQKKELYDTYMEYIDAVYLEYCDDAC